MKAPGEVAQSEHAPPPPDQQKEGVKPVKPLSGCVSAESGWCRDVWKGIKNSLSRRKNLNI
jgi:hypothetical protein